MYIWLDLAWHDGYRFVKCERGGETNEIMWVKLIYYDRHKKVKEGLQIKIISYIKKPYVVNYNRKVSNYELDFTVKKQDLPMTGMQV